ncbi:MAG: nucleotide exchange factor GrpE [Clostridia bacterium]|nr:nucleotide exchange factor GrpE [Clostridia bacterium]
MSKKEQETPEVQQAEAVSESASVAEELKARLEEQNDRYLRLLAEYDNFRKRSAKEKEGLYAAGICEAAKTMLAVADNFDRALMAECTDKAFLEGVLLIQKQLKTVFDQLKITEIAETGIPFDPSVHHAVMHVEDESLGEQVVVEVLAKGYRCEERLLRAAMVKVAN